MSKGNSPAFPCVDKDKRMWTGMNLRDYFALETLNGLIQHSGEIENIPYIAKYSYEVANAMLDEREKYR